MLQPVFLLGEAVHASPGEPGRGWVCEAVGLWEELEGWGSRGLLLWGAKVPRRRLGERRGCSVLCMEEMESLSCCGHLGRFEWVGDRLQQRGSRLLAAEGELVAFGVSFSTCSQFIW